MGQEDCEVSVDEWYFGREEKYGQGSWSSGPHRNSSLPSLRTDFYSKTLILISVTGSILTVP